ncbi:MAG: hypothetical protein NG740_00980 [Omnitrophica bacterium]|nr:hypothetical protein [Candidatus Omnitrophota bacterium]
MTLSAKQKIILWITIGLIVLLVGLNAERDQRYTKDIINTDKIKMYGLVSVDTVKFFGLNIGSSTITVEPSKVKKNKSIFSDSSKGFWWLWLLAYYKYQLIVATLLIGLMLFITLRKK